ncbi:hypothetical protein HDU90_004236 [Geranomyces variabilis]|nr:hypothetical protein HDU90_004236 [Geranomyces variabilis]
MPNGTFTWSISGERTVAILKVSFTPTKLSISGENLLFEITGGTLSLAFTLALFAYFFTKWIGKTKPLSSIVEATKEITNEQPAEIQLTEPEAKMAGPVAEIAKQAQAFVSLGQEVDIDTARFLRDIEKEAPELLSRAQDYSHAVGKLAQSLGHAAGIILSSRSEALEAQKLADYEVALEQLAPAIAARTEEIREKTGRLIDQACDLCSSVWDLDEELKDE